jgi:predicted enzyme related to lactoylglutathione lyase
VAVDDVDTVVAAVVTVLIEKTTIAGVGDLVFFADPSGNVCGAMRYDPDAD